MRYYLWIQHIRIWP